MARFDHYVITDWSAASTPKQGRDSIWICHRGPHGERCANPPTRHAAQALLGEILAAAAGRGERAVLGFDFPFGYPAGFAARLGLSGVPWRAVWDEIARLIEDGPDNRNNRFAVGALLNRRVSGGRFPFWGCPAGFADAHLGPRHHNGHAPGGLAEKRLIDRHMTGAQPCWKLAYTGSVGGQALTGIPVVRALRDDGRWAARARVWPFETGLALPAAAEIVFAEVWPSWWRVSPEPGEVKDRAQVRRVAAAFAAADRAGELEGWFAGDPALAPAERRLVEREEAWTLGVTAPRKPRLDYLRDPAAIYRKSFATVRQTADLARFPAGLRPLAVRLAHAAGDVAILAELAWSKGAAAAGRRALAAGAPILVDGTMTAAGIAAAERVVCTLRDPEVPELAARLGTTRAAAAVELWRERLAGAVVAIGSAPTALFRLLELVAAGAPRPALVLGFPVGFVGAAEAKQALAASGLRFIALHGTRGGSALAAAAVNALLAGSKG